MQLNTLGVEELHAGEAREIDGGVIDAVVVAVAAMFVAAFGAGFKAGYERGSQ